MLFISLLPPDLSEHLILLVSFVSSNILAITNKLEGRSDCRNYELSKNQNKQTNKQTKKKQVKKNQTNRQVH